MRWASGAAAPQCTTSVRLTGVAVLEECLAHVRVRVRVGGGVRVRVGVGIGVRVRVWVRGWG